MRWNQPFKCSFITVYHIYLKFGAEIEENDPG